MNPDTHQETTMKTLLVSTVLTTALLTGCAGTESTTSKSKPEVNSVPDREIITANRCIERQDRVDALHVCSSVDMVKLRKADPELANQVSAALDKAREADRINSELGSWYYNTWKDDATGKDYKLAHVTSENTINLDFPYSGSQHGRLNLRNHPRYGFDAFLSIDQGQILCDRYSNTTVLVRADDGPAKSYRCNSPADHSSETVFIEGFQALENQIKGAKKVYVTVSIYQSGSQTFEFKVKGYDSTRI